MTAPALAAVIAAATARLAAAAIDNPALDARLLIAHALGVDRAQLLSQSTRALTERERQCIDALLARRLSREPVARIFETREFWSLPFGLNEATLVPRAESETLVEGVLAKIGDSGFGIREKDARIPNPESRILDLGTGTGCLLLALLHELPDASGLGIDSAPRAVEQARQNAERLGLAGRANFKIGNWADGIAERFDLVISNPPYIAQAEIPGLMPEVRDYDPALALDGGADGLAAYRALIPQLPRLLTPDGAAVFEIGIGQGEAVRGLFQKAGFKKLETRRDLSGIERCIMARNT